MFWFIVLLLIAGAGFYFYQKLMAIEQEIRAEQASEAARASATAGDVPEETVAGKEVHQKAVAVEPPGIVVEEREPTVAETPVADEGVTPEEEILAAVKNLPGIKQTALYESFSDIEKKKFQRMVKKLTDEGQLKREKEGSSYVLHPV